ncbi:MAG: globin domain-containing protein, partial [Pseudomonadota bacterium]
GLHMPERILPTARDLAGRHVAYGVTPAMYAPVGDALIWTIERGMGDGFTPETREAWETAYGMLSTAMVESAYPKAGAPKVAAE